VISFSRCAPLSAQDIVPTPPSEDLQDLEPRFDGLVADVMFTSEGGVGQDSHLVVAFDIGEDATEGLVKLRDGSDDIAVCISGFGSAKADSDRWLPVFEITGRTTFVVKYDAQEFPWADGDVPRGVGDLIRVGAELHDRWARARLAAIGISDCLAGWIQRWTDAGRRVLVVGFSLGGLVAWKACRKVASERVDLVMISAAIGDRPETWEGIENLGKVINLYSSHDVVLKHLYPHGVGGDETPAAGLGPICSSSTNVDNVDVTDRVGRDHLWASKNLGSLIRIAVGYMCGGVSSGVCFSVPKEGIPERQVRLPLDVIERSYRWMCTDPRLWSIFGNAILEDPESVSYCLALDRWATSDPERFPVLSALGISVSSLSRSRHGRASALRSYRELSGLLRLWMSSGLGDAPGVGLVSTGEDVPGVPRSLSGSI
jgi:pimeloyl-ACP methyl ester carboxylesterase